MKNLFKYAASYWKAMIAIVLILFIQAYCDLSLPAYTSDIVNVGIQQGGIEDEIPEQIAQEEMDKLLLFVSEEDGQKVMDAYEEDTTSYEKDAYVLKESVSGDEEQMKELQDILKLPMMMTTGFESGSDMTKEVESQLKSSLPDGTVSEDTTIFDIMKMLPGEQRTAMVERWENRWMIFRIRFWIRQRSAIANRSIRIWAWTWKRFRQDILQRPGE